MYTDHTNHNNPYMSTWCGHVWVVMSGHLRSACSTRVRTYVLVHTKRVFGIQSTYMWSWFTVREEAVFLSRGQCCSTVQPRRIKNRRKEEHAQFWLGLCCLCQNGRVREYLVFSWTPLDTFTNFLSFSLRTPFLRQQWIWNCLAVHCRKYLPFAVTIFTFYQLYDPYNNEYRMVDIHLYIIHVCV